MQQMLEYRTTGTALDAMEPGLGGIFTFGPPDPLATGALVGLPTIGTRPENATLPYGAWGFRSRSHLAFPWGKKFPDRTQVTVGPERFLLRHMSPFNTRKLLKLANILPTKVSSATVDNTTWPEKQYMTNRKASEQWNDAWGHPLVVGSVLYQPTYQTRAPSPTPPRWKDEAWPKPATSTTVFDDSTTNVTSSTYLPSTEDEARKALLDHMKLYQYNRSVYIAVAAVGPSARVTDIQLKSNVPADWADSATLPKSGILDTLWSQANWVCQQAKKNPYDKDWSELSFDNPPWNGNKYDSLTPSKKLSDQNSAESTYNTYTGKEEHCLLSAPLEYK
jgi:hypothetical protein